MSGRPTGLCGAGELPLPVARGAAVLKPVQKSLWGVGGVVQPRQQAHRLVEDAEVVALGLEIAEAQEGVDEVEHRRHGHHGTELQPLACGGGGSHGVRTVPAVRLGADDPAGDADGLRRILHSPPFARSTPVAWRPRRESNPRPRD